MGRSDECVPNSAPGGRESGLGFRADAQVWGLGVEEFWEVGVRIKGRFGLQG